MSHSGTYLLRNLSTSSSLTTAYCDMTKNPSDPALQSILGRMQLDFKRTVVFGFMGQDGSKTTGNVTFNTLIYSIGTPDGWNGNSSGLSLSYFSSPVEGTFLIRFELGLYSDLVNISLAVNGKTRSKFVSNSTENASRKFRDSSRLSLEEGDAVSLHVSCSCREWRTEYYNNRRKVCVAGNEQCLANTLRTISGEMVWP